MRRLVSMRRLAPADACYGLALLSLPLVGVDLIMIVSGRDLGAGLQPAYLLLAVAWALRLGALLLRPEALRPTAPGGSDRAGLLWALLAVGALLLSGLGLVLAPAPLLAHEAWPRFAKQVVQVVIMAAFLVYPALWTRGPRRWRWSLQLVAWATAAQILYAFLQGLHVLVDLPAMALAERLATSNQSILSGSTWLYLGSFTELPRLRGTMCEPLYLGSYLVGVLPLLLWSGRRGLAAVGLVVLLLTWSRGAWLAAAGGVFVWWLLRRRAGLAVPTRHGLLIVGAACGLGLLAVVLFAGPAAVGWPIQRLLQSFDTADWSNLTRYYSAQAAWRAWLESPLVGVGWGQFPYHFYALVDLPGLQSQFTWPVVNIWPLLVLCETGLIGFGVLAGACAVLWRRTWNAMVGGAGAAERALLAAAAAGGCGLGLHLLTFSQYNLPHLWVLPGLWLAALAACRRSRPANERNSR
jgi:hypothetical protein